MAWTRKTSAGKYRVSYRDPSGKTKSKTFALARDAKAFSDKIGTQVRDGSYVDPARGKITFADYWKVFLTETPRRASTMDRYARQYRLYLEPEFADRRLHAITTEQVRAWRTAMAELAGASTVEAVTRLLKSVFNAAVDDERIPRNPARGIKNPSVDPQGGVRVLEAGEVATLADAIHPRFHALVYVLGVRGLRIGEAVALRVGDVDLLGGKLRIDKQITAAGGAQVEGPPKTAAGIRTVSIPSFLRDILTAHLAAFSDPTDPTALVFPSHRGDIIRVGNVRRRAWADAVTALVRSVADPQRKLLLADLTPHDLRDTAATLAFQAGASVKEVANMLGHANPAITLRTYTGVLDSMSEATDEKLGAAFGAATPTPAVAPTVVQLAR